MFSRVFAPVCLIAMALFAQSVAAQTVYRSTMPDGSVIFADQPVQGAAKVETSRPNTSDSGVQVIAPGAEDELQQMQSEREAGQAQVDERGQAEKALRQAEDALASGKEPLPGERIGTAGGSSRLNDAYWARQNRLQQNVDSARRRLDDL